MAKGKPRKRAPAANPGQPHRWTSEEASQAGRLGGLAKARNLEAAQESTPEDAYNETFAADQDPEEDESHG